MSFSVKKIRRDFPMIAKGFEGSPLVYLDNGATTLKPKAVIEALSDYYCSYSANVHRALHGPAKKATSEYEKTRSLVQSRINASSSDEIILTSGTTAGLNLLAHSYGSLLGPEDEILLTVSDHHSNIVPWQLLRERKGVVLKVIPVSDRGELEMPALTSLLSKKTKLVVLPHVSNTLGTINPVGEIVSLVKKNSKALVIVDGAQGIPHLRVDVRDLGVDFYVFSSHKVFGPTGLGVLYGKKELLERMPPFLGGGDMVDQVDFAETTYAPIPYKFEAGTPHIAGSIGLGAAIRYLESLDFEGVMAHEEELTICGLELLKGISGLHLLGEASQRVPLFTFVIEGAHAQDLGMILGQKGLAVRTGHHCTWPLLKRFGADSTTRASLAMYNTVEEIEQLAKGIREALKILAV
ncbi:MAG: SufS family cysteine desulfurase [Bacteriovoracales bacterium]|nr:SufS family cysteine desulfurase [Bacteriovoracales bacterium]